MQTAHLEAEALRLRSLANAKTGAFAGKEGISSEDGGGPEGRSSELAPADGVELSAEEVSLQLQKRGLAATEVPSQVLIELVTDLEGQVRRVGICCVSNVHLNGESATRECASSAKASKQGFEAFLFNAQANSLASQLGAAREEANAWKATAEQLQMQQERSLRERDEAEKERLRLLQRLASLDSRVDQLSQQNRLKSERLVLLEGEVSRINKTVSAPDTDRILCVEMDALGVRRL